MNLEREKRGPLAMDATARVREMIRQALLQIVSFAEVDVAAVRSAECVDAGLPRRQIYTHHIERHRRLTRADEHNFRMPVGKA
jgi:hypothetical protein